MELFWDKRDAVWAKASLESLCYEEWFCCCHQAELWDLLLGEQLDAYFPSIWGTCFSLLPKVNAKWDLRVLYCLRMTVGSILALYVQGSGCSSRRCLSLLSWITESKLWLTYFFPYRGKFCHHIIHVTFWMNLVIIICFGLASFRLKPLPFRKRKP